MKNYRARVFALVTVFILLISCFILTKIMFKPSTPASINNISGNIDSKAKINIKSILPLSSEDFVIKDDNNYIELGGDYKDLKTNDKIAMTIPANEKRAYIINKYENFNLMICGNTIGEIDIKTPIFQTSRGIRIGDSISKVFKKYGNPEDSDKEKPYYAYFNKDGYLSFYVDKNKNVNCIKFEMAG